MAETIQKQPKTKAQKVVEELEPLDVEVSESAKEALEDADKVLDEIDCILDEETVAKMKEIQKPKSEITLSDLMREGAEGSKQAIGTWTRPSGETCALSAAMLAARTRKLA